MDRISRHSHGDEGIRFGGIKIGTMLFADNVVLLASSECDLWRRSCPEWRGSMIWGCSRMSEKWCGRSIGRLVRHLQLCSCHTSLSRWRESWALRQSSRFTGWSLFIPSSMVTNFGWWSKEQDHRYKWVKWSSSAECLGSPLEIGWEALSSRRELK